MKQKTNITALPKKESQKEKVDKSIMDVISSAKFINGPQVTQFSQNLDLPSQP